MNSTALFFRLLADEDKGDRLGEITIDVRKGERDTSIFATNQVSFDSIPSAPMAYWVSETLLKSFALFPALEGKERAARFGLSTKDDVRFLRAWWEISSAALGVRWFGLVKGGAFSRYYSDVYLCIDWQENGAELKKWAVERTTEIFGSGSWSRWINGVDFYFRPGLTWSRRTNGFSVRVLPRGCIFADKGPAAFVEDDSEIDLLSLSAVMNSAAFLSLIQVRLARVDLAQSYEVGLIQETPIPELSDGDRLQLAELAAISHDLKRSFAVQDETTHEFIALDFTESTNLASMMEVNDSVIRIKYAELARLQADINTKVASLYGFSAPIEIAEAESETADDSQNSDEDIDKEAISRSSTRIVADLISYGLGVLLGRWDIRFALDPSLAPKMQGSFDPLPVCSPGMLIGPDGLPANHGGIVSEEWLHARPDVISLPPEGFVAQPTIADDDYPLRIDWDGILVDDEGHSDDIVERSQDVLTLLWGERAEAIEAEACQILGVRNLRHYFRDPKRFWDFHVKRYSKSRRKAPIYWLLQSSKRSYALWLYYHRLDSDTLFKAIRYVTDRLQLEQARLSEALTELTTAESDPKSRRPLEKRIGEHEAFIVEVTAFRTELQRVADLGFVVDHDDGVLLSIAPLHNLVPWAPAKAAWNELVAGKYAWSRIGQQMREKGLVKGNDRG